MAEGGARLDNIPGIRNLRKVVPPYKEKPTESTPLGENGIAMLSRKPYDANGLTELSDGTKVKLNQPIGSIIFNFRAIGEDESQEHYLAYVRSAGTSVMQDVTRLCLRRDPAVNNLSVFGSISREAETLGFQTFSISESEPEERVERHQLKEVERTLSPQPNLLKQVIGNRAPGEPTPARQMLISRPQVIARFGPRSVMEQ